jgi:NAD(P)-dependent dehydrogenase (short-subunit alcohol dehydrogenase family)
LVNNAGNFFAGFFEEITPDDFRAQIETNLFGPVNATRAALPQIAGTAERADRNDIVGGRHRRPGFRLGLFRVEVRR